MVNQIYFGDCLDILPNISNNSIDLIYLDPPFFTNKIFKGTARHSNAEFCFNDIWENSSEYAKFLFDRLAVCYPLLKETGSIVVHCDRNSNHIIRFVLDAIFGKENFQSEIIWTYKRWSNAKKGLLNQHQNLLFYSKSNLFKWNEQFVEYSPSTNLDQIFQKREKDKTGKSIYAQDNSGNIIFGGAKKGVPLGDVWDIPYLNPKAKERTGYPTQKPLILLERIITLLTDKNDIVLDPFCGSGTTLVASKLLNRQYIGIDISKEACQLSQERLDNPIKTHSVVAKNGLEVFKNNNEWVEQHLIGFDYIRVQRNNGLDATLKNAINGKVVFLKVQDQQENLSDSYQKLKKALNKKPNSLGFLIQTQQELPELLAFNDNHPDNIKVIKSAFCQFYETTNTLKQEPL